MSYFHIAQLNVARAKAEMETELMSGFVSRLDEINARADCAPGFVWRLTGDGASATSVRVFDDPLILVNMSVWESLESLKQFVYKSNHVELIRDRDAWFNKMTDAHQALWWVRSGHIPSVEEARQKLEHLRIHGPTEESFTFAKAQPMPLQ